jgi:hypothetical protein
VTGPHNNARPVLGSLPTSVVRLVYNADLSAALYNTQQIQNRL